MIEKVVKIFMDNLTIFINDFDGCLNNLKKVLERCEETNLVLNWKKCQFMVSSSIALSHLTSKKKIKVDKAKINTIANLLTPTCVRNIRSFLSHDGFYKRFIKDF